MEEKAKNSQIEKAEMTRNISRVYQLAVNENPGAVIAQVQFNGENFDEWAQAVRTALRVKQKFGFVDGTVTEPDMRNDDYEDWLSAKSMVALWILNTIDPKVRRTLASKEDPKELWTEIRDRFSEGNGPRIQEIKAELAHCRQGNMSVIEYFGKLQMLWEDLVNYDQIVACKCGKCTCNLSIELEKKKEEDRIHQFLLGLDTATYGGIRTTIISMDPLPNMNQVYSKVKSVERVNTVMRGREQQNTQVAFAVRGNTTNAREEKGKMICTVCKKTGHTSETCFQVIGYPEWWSEKGKGTGGIGRGGGRFGVGRGQGGMARANMTITQNDAGNGEAEKNGYTGLTNDQWNTLMKLIGDKQGTSTSR